MNGDLARFLDLEPGDLRDDSLPDSKQSLQDLQVHVDVLSSKSSARSMIVTRAGVCSSSYRNS